MCLNWDEGQRMEVFRDVTDLVEDVRKPYNDLSKPHDAIKGGSLTLTTLNAW